MNSKSFKYLFLRPAAIVIVLALIFSSGASVPFVFASEPTEFLADPHMAIFPDNDWLDGMDWPDGPVQVTVELKPICSFTASSSEGWFNGNFPAGCDITPGDRVTMAGGGFTVTHLVENLLFTSMDLDSNIVTGTADSGKTVGLWAWNGPERVDLTAVDNAFQYDFSDMGYDLYYDECVRAEIMGEGINSTVDDICVYQPSINVRANTDEIEIYNWAVGNPLNVEIDDPGTEGLDFSTTIDSTNPASPDGSQTYYYLPLNGVFDIQPGFTVSVDGHGVGKSLTVSTLIFTNIDQVENVVSGQAYAGMRVNIWACDLAICHNRHVNADVSTDWAVDFDITGDEPNEQTTIDITAGTWIDSNQCDDENDCTMYGVGLPNPFFAALPQYDTVETWEWELGTIVHLTIDDPATPAEIDYEDTGISAIPEWDPNGRYLSFYFGEIYDLKADDIVTLTDGVLTRTHTVENLAVTSVGSASDIIAGMADPGKEIIAWPHATGEPLTTTADENGIWLIDFNGIYDIRDYVGGRAEIRDGQRNATSIDWNAPKPFLIAFPEGEAVEGWEFPEHETVSLTINNALGLLVEGQAEVTTWGDPRTYVNLGFSEQYNLVTGDVVTLTSPGVLAPISHTVRSLTISEVDMVTDTVTGTASPDEQIQVWPHGHDQDAFLSITADESGNWTADFSGIFDLKPGVGGRAQILDGNWFATAVDWNVPFPFFRDDFDGPLADGWTWINENEELWDFTTDPAGFLRIFTSEYGLGGENLLLRPVLPVDFTIETHVFFEPASDFQFAGLVLYQDNENFIQLGRAFCDIPDICVGNGIYFDYVAGGNQIHPNFATQTDLTNEAYLRLERRGGRVRGLFSADGEYWVEIGTHQFDENIRFTAVGLTSSQNFFDADVVPADFDYFELTEGWGFLPEGYHDYTEGDVVHWDCNAGGWAVDPDDRDTDIWVAVDVDGVKLADWTQANEYRPDLEESGECMGGSCGFNTSIWDRIDTYETHQISVYAKDNLMAKWVRLNASPKSLTCRTFDIYTFDPATSEIKQITNMRDADEYNPAWSPNGQYVVHHTSFINGDPGSLYITTVKTGESRPLPGTEWSSWQSWSPNGRWIIFGKDNNLYMVSPTGTQPAFLVRKNAEMASFAPNGRRIVFRDLNDNMLHTMQVDRGKGGETNLGVYGDFPDWSPDGNWIAYGDGDIWKIGVNGLGMVRSEPIQLTHLYQWEGHATWSPDAKTIVYHAGITSDGDLWSVPAAGGDPTWLNGAPTIGDYDPDYALDKDLIAYASASPFGQAPRTWVTVYTHDLPPDFWTEGAHSYQFLAEGHDPTTPRVFNVSINNPRYDGTALLRQGGTRLQLGEECAFLDGINPSQPTQFNMGWIEDGSYSEFLDILDSLVPSVTWDEVNSAPMMRHEVFPFTQGMALMPYICRYSEGPPKMDLRVNYGHDWVESFYEAGHQVDVTVTDAKGNVKDTATSYTGPRGEWVGAEGFQTADSDWSLGAPPDIQPYDWVYAVVDNGVTAKVQIGEVRAGVDILSNQVSGNVVAPWIDTRVDMECLDWGSGMEGLDNQHPGSVLTDGVESFACSWGADWDIQPWQDIGVAYVTPDGHWVANAVRFEAWMAFWTADVPVDTFVEGSYSYQYQVDFTVPDPVSFTHGPLDLKVSSEASAYDGKVLIGPWVGRPQFAWTGAGCEVAESILPGQAARFVFGWVPDNSMTYEEALAHYNSFNITASWTGPTSGSAVLGTLSEVVPFSSLEERLGYLCTLTEHP